MKKIYFYVFVFVVSIAQIGCEKEEISRESELIEINRFEVPVNWEILSYDSQELMEISSLGKLKIHKGGLDNLKVLNDDVLKIDYAEGTTYTFKISRPQPEFLIENFVYFFNKETETSQAFLVQYDITLEEFIDIGKVPFENSEKVLITPLNVEFRFKSFDCQQTSQTMYVSCSSGEHHSGNIGAWGSCTADTKPYTYQEVRTACTWISHKGDSPGSPGGGGTGGGGGGGEPIITNPNPSEPCLDNNGTPIGFPDENGNCGGALIPLPVPPEEEDCNTSKEALMEMFRDADPAEMEILAETINRYNADFGIDTKEELQHFLAQAGHETGGFQTLNVTESTYWTTASKLARTYSKFTMDSTAAANNNDLYYAPSYLRDPKGVANIAMCCLFGNGPVTSGDGYKYKGRGIFQLTWRDNYADFQNWYNNSFDSEENFVENPNLIAENKTFAIMSGMWFYMSRVLNEFNVTHLTTVEKVTEEINSAQKNILDRKRWFSIATEKIECL